MYNDFKTANYPFSLISPEMHARHLFALIGKGVVDGFKVVPSSGLTVTIQSGNALVQFGAGGAQSARMVSLVDNFNLTHDPADLSNPRIDTIVLYVDNSVVLPTVDDNNPPTAANDDGPGVAKAIIVKGTPNATPSAPDASAIQTAVGSGNPYEVLSNNLIGAGVSVISDSNITDLRGFAKVRSRNMDFATSSPSAYNENNASGTTTSSTPISGLSGGGTTPNVTLNVPESGKVMVAVRATVSSSDTSTLRRVRLHITLVGNNSGSHIALGTVMPSTTANEVAATIFLTGLNPGSTQFILQYSISGGTLTASNRSIGVISVPA